MLVFFNASRIIRKRTDTDVAFTQEYSKVSISTGNAKCTNQGSRSFEDKDRKMFLWVERNFLRFPGQSKESRIELFQGYSLWDIRTLAMD